MMLKSVAAAAAFLMASLASAATVYNAGAYTVTYDQSTLLGTISGSWSSAGNTFGFEWSVPTGVSLANNGGPAASATFALPSFTLVANPGYELSGTLVGSLGNISYAEFNGSTGMQADVTVKLNNGADWVVPTTALTKSPTNAFQGYFSGTGSVPLSGVTSFELKNATITLTATAGSFAAIGAQPQNTFSFSFAAVPVPEPESYALLLVGLGAIGLFSRRRQPR
jgi:hypothetical protein